MNYSESINKALAILGNDAIFAWDYVPMQGKLRIDINEAIKGIKEIHNDFEKKIIKKINNIEDYGWMTYEDKQQCIDILYELIENNNE